MQHLVLCRRVFTFLSYFDVSLFAIAAGWEAKVINRRMVFINHTTKVKAEFGAAGVCYPFFSISRSIPLETECFGPWRRRGALSFLF